MRAGRLDAREAQDRAWGDAMAREGGVSLAPPPANVHRLGGARSSAPRAIARDAIHIGDDAGGPLGIDLQKLMEGRLLVQGASGAGKSWTLRRLLEQTAGAVQQIIIDPEGEFGSFAETYGVLTIDTELLDPAAITLAARRAREHRLSVLFDLSELEREDQMIAVANIFIALVDAPREQWHPAMVLVDEAHLFAPFGGQSDMPTSVRKAAIGALVDLMSRGRKRGLCGVLATQRLARLSKSVASEVHNFLIGLNTLDLDIRRAAETIGWDGRRAQNALPQLLPGDFVAVGPCFSESPLTIRVGPVQTEHRGAAPELSEAPIVAPAAARGLLDLDRLIEQSAADEAIRSEGSFQPGLRAIRAFIRDPAFAAAGRIWSALAPLLPGGARLADLAQHLQLPIDDVAAAIALLDAQGTVDFVGDGAERAVRIAKGMRP
jgi:PAS domain-containing protein